MNKTQEFKSRSFHDGLIKIQKFYELNNHRMSRVPSIRFDHEELPNGMSFGTCGFYRYKTREIYVNLAYCAGVARNPRQWSWMGYKINRTPQGVICHEFGHFMDHQIGHMSDFVSREFLNERVSGYEPNKSEAFAETFRVFITNPDLLRVGFPHRYWYLTNRCQFTPPPAGSWDEVLKENGAPERFIEAARKLVVKK